MRTRLCLLLLLSVKVFAQTPGLAQSMMGSSTGSKTISASGNMTVPLPDGSQSGNLLITGCTYDTTTSTGAFATETDDQSNTWSVGLRTNNTTLQQAVSLLYAVNVAANTRVLHPTLNAVATHSAQCGAAEFFNVANAAPDGSHGNSSSSTTTSVTAGSFTPTQSGDLLVNFIWTSSDIGTAQFPAGSNANITWKLCPGTGQVMSGAVGIDHFYCQWGVYNSTAAINPTITLPTAAKFVSVVLAFKHASAGGDIPAGIRIRGIEHLEVPANTGSPQTFQFPCMGNLPILLVNGNGINITSITSDSNGNTWAQAGTIATQATEDAQIWYAANATCSSTEKFTINFSGTTADMSAWIYDVTGAAASPYDTDVSQTGNAGTGGGGDGNPPNDLTQGSITPSTANGLIVGHQSHVFNTFSGVATGTFDGMTYTAQSCDGPDPIDQNQGPFHYYNPNTSAVTLTWHFVSTCINDAASNWAGKMAAFKAPAAGGSAAVGFNKRRKLEKLQDF